MTHIADLSTEDILGYLVTLGSITIDPNDTTWRTFHIVEHTPHDIMWAVEQFRIGAPIRRREWIPSAYMSLTSANHPIYYDDVLATDWELA
jgi:hypothetical protein